MGADRVSDGPDIQVGAAALPTPGESALKRSRRTAEQREAVSTMIAAAAKLQLGERICVGKVKLRDPEMNYLRNADGTIQTRPCKKNAMRGGVVCHMHGGTAKQVKRKSEQRLRAMAEPALIRLNELVQQDDHLPTSLGAIKEVLMRAGGIAVGPMRDDGGERDMRPQISVNIAVGGLDMVKAGIKVNSALLPMAAAEIIEADDA